MLNVTDLARKKCHVGGILARLFVVLIENYQKRQNINLNQSSIPEFKLFHFSQIAIFFCFERFEKLVLTIIFVPVFVGANFHVVNTIVKTFATGGTVGDAQMSLLTS